MLFRSGVPTAVKNPSGAPDAPAGVCPPASCVVRFLWVTSAPAVGSVNVGSGAPGAPFSATVTESDSAVTHSIDITLSPGTYHWQAASVAGAYRTQSQDLALVIP